MQKLTYVICLLLGVFTIQANAPQNLFGGQDIESAVVNSDNTVTFRFIAPDAKSVSVAGDFVEETAENPIGGMVNSGTIPMTKDANGLWTLTTKPLASELYSYLFQVDGIATTDPNNPYVFRDFATITNVFIVGNGQGDLYKVNDVQHGSLTHRWYQSKSLGVNRRINIYTPPGYENGKKKYPTLYLLHGYGGDEDDFLFNQNTEFRALLDKTGLKYIFVETGGGHIWKCWRIYLSDFTPLLFK